MSKINYGVMLDKKLEELSRTGQKPSLLLHACCAPCSSYVLEYLNAFFEITLYFCNPNVAPENEYNYRLNELKRLVAEMNLNIIVVEEQYNAEPFYQLAQGLENLPERGERCRKCIAYRLQMAGKKAAELKSDCFTTTLTISPHKDCAFINECGAEVSAECGVDYLFSDFKKREGYKRSIQLSQEYNLYRQNYCGCVYSKALMENIQNA